MSETTTNVERIGKAVEEWYSSAWHRGVRITGVERQLLVHFLAQREDVHQWLHEMVRPLYEEIDRRFQESDPEEAS